MQRITGKVKYWFLWIMILNSFSLAANDDVLPSLEVDNQQFRDVYEKLLYFDSIEGIDSINHYAEIGHSFYHRINSDTIQSREVRLAVAGILYYYGNSTLHGNDPIKSVKAFEKSSAIYKAENEMHKYADAILDLAVAYSRVGKEPLSMQLLHDATSLYVDFKDSAGLTSGYRSIGILYNRQKDYERANEYLMKALALSRDSDNVDATVYLLVSIATMNKRQGKLDEALELFLEALSLSEFTHDDLTRINVYSNLAQFYKNTGELDKAKVYFDRTAEMIEKTDSDYDRSYLWLNLTDYYFLKGEYQTSIAYGQKALDLSRKIKNRRAEYVTLNILLKVYEEINDTENLAFHQEKVIDFLNEHKEQLNDQLNELETVRYKLDKQSLIAENEQIKLELKTAEEGERRSYIYMLLAGLFILLLIFALIIVFRLRTVRKHNKIITKQSEERKLLLQEVHHRVKNNFQIVSSMLRLQSHGFENEVLRQNFEEAVNRINAMAIVHDVIYRQEKFKDIDAKNYLERLVENLNKTGTTPIKIAIDSEKIPFKVETLINLGIALNELITNSFKHAFTEDITDPKIKISLHRVEQNFFELVYRDNGVGFIKEYYETSFGMELIETIISNYDGILKHNSEKDWNTVISFTFKEE
ncbi:histidine kinase dimerization/phosphoacceptor domain -containing protein [Brumimicrobium oceani]|uniref:histidine kinase n=1 Tax=Brumimicrobium oceani TaxID=2100725 RepID=A0A2U2XAS3_9FLAO|nr:histidine kinase dimerization/phosphoacceptor domain -containing protein [Brumimicrobium oceani]PWH84857.1 hypothetical protein DIT68_11985 [Brumimicrobium oceani]